MSPINHRLLFVLGTVLLSVLPLTAQNKFEGVLRNTGDYTIPTPVPTPTATITVFQAGGLAGGTTTVAASTLQNCAGGTITNPFTSDPGRWCFKGPSSAYDVQVSYPSTYKFRVISEDTIEAAGRYKLTDFGAIPGDSNDNTYALKSAMAYVGTRFEPGGRLFVPNGIFKVLGGNATLPIVMAPGVTLFGTNGRGSFGSSRIQLSVNQNILFRITNDTHRVSVRDLTLIYCGESGNCTDGVNTKAIYAEGDDGKASQGFVADNITIQNFAEGISVAGKPGSNLDWQFGSAKITNSTISAVYPVRLNAQNAELKIENCVLLTIRQSAGPLQNNEAALFIERSGPVEMYRMYGGSVGRSNPNDLPLAFVLVRGRHGAITMVDSESENTVYNLLYDYTPPADDGKAQVRLENNNFGDLVVFKGNVILKSSNNSYAANGVQFWNSSKGGASTASEIYSYGDTFSDLTNKLQVCPVATGVTQAYHPAVQANGDFTRLSTAEITSGQGDAASLEKNVCRRDFYLFNTNGGESNRVVARTAQRAYSTGDSDILQETNFQTPVNISSPPVFDANTDPQYSLDRFKVWGYQIRRNPSDGVLEFLGNQKPPKFGWNAAAFRFNSSVYPTDDNAYEMGNATARWALVRGVVVTAGDAILTDRVTGKELYKIHEDENFIYFTDIRSGKQMMKIGRDGNLYLSGKIIQNSLATPVVRNRAARTTKRRRQK